MAARGLEVTNANGIIVEMLTEGPGGGAATMADLNAWESTYRLNVTTGIDLPGSRRAFMVLGVRETSYFVDLRTMRIVTKISGDRSGISGDATMTNVINQFLTLCRS
jgi:hypothetical protein